MDLPERAPARLPICGIAALVAVAAGLRSQAPLPLAPGYAATELVRETGHPLGFAGFTPGRGSGDLFFAVDHAVWHRDAAGNVTLVHAFPVRARCDLLVHPPGHGALYYADDLSGGMVVRDLATGTESVRPLLPNTFDLDVTAGGDLLASANPLWPGTGARPGIWLLDPQGGTAHREIVALDGVSGPLVVDRASGDVLYATQNASYPTPPGSVTVLRFPAARVAAAIAGGPTLTARDAVPFAAGLDGAFDLAFDDRGRLLVSDPIDGRVERIRRDGSLDPVPLVPAHGRSALGLAFLDGGPATFDPYQPGDGGVLLVGVNDWATFGGVFAVRPARPEATSPSGPTASAGNLAVELTGLPPGGVAWVLFNHRPPLVPEPALFEIGGAPVFWALDMTVPPLSAPVRSGATGSARLDLPYSGGLSWTLTFQAAAVATPSGVPLVVTSTPLTITLLP